MFELWLTVIIEDQSLLEEDDVTKQTFYATVVQVERDILFISSM